MKKYLFSLFLLIFCTSCFPQSSVSIDIRMKINDYVKLSGRKSLVTDGKIINIDFHGKIYT